MYTAALLPNSDSETVRSNFGSVNHNKGEKQ